MKIVQHPANEEGFKPLISLELTNDELALITGILGDTNEEDHPDSYEIFSPLARFCGEQGILFLNG